MPKAACIVYRMPKLVDYVTSWRHQKALSVMLNAQRKAEDTDTYHRLIITQHPSIYTLGRGSTLDNLRFDVDRSSEDVVRVERGGEVTWHGPGQLVAYPIFDLNYAPLKKDLHWFMNSLEETVVLTLSGYGLDAGRSEVNNGVWVGKNKIAAVGVTASRWVTMHGLALNIQPDMTAYNRIVPCGISEPGYGVTSLSRELGANYDGGDGGAATGTHSVDAVAADLVTSFGSVFDMDMLESPQPEIEIDIIAEMNPTKDTLLDLHR